MLQAFLDDSGSHDGSHNCVIGGYWGGVNEWRRFERLWKPVLDSEGIGEFHAKEFWPMINGERIGPYKGWSDRRHSDFINRLLDVIGQSKIYPFACGVLGGEWDKQPPDYREIFTKQENPKSQRSLYVPFQRIILRTISYCHPGLRMNFVYDSDPKNPSNQKVISALTKCFLIIQLGLKADSSPMHERLGELTFDDPAKAIPLQAADLLAYEAHRYAKKVAANSNYKMRREYAFALRRFKSRDDFWLFDAPRFARIHTHFQKTDKEYNHEK